MNLSSVKAITINGSAVKQIDIGGRTVWNSTLPREWDLLNRNEVIVNRSNLQTNPIADLLSQSNWFNGIQIIGRYMFGNNACVLTNITSNGFTLTNPVGNYGFGMPYPINNGETVSLSLNKNSACQIYAVYYDSNGYQVSSQSLANFGSNINVSDTSNIDGWLVLVFAPYDANQTVTFSNVNVSIG